MTKSVADNSLSPEQVADFLRQQPDFFHQFPNLLADLELPHESGEAVSLVERQVSVLRERNMDMRHRLSKLLGNARDNDRLFDKTKRLVLALLEAKSVDDIVDSLFYSFDKDFNIHYTQLVIYGNPDVMPATRARVIRVQEAREYIGPLLRTNKAICGTLEDKEISYLFGEEDAKDIGSVAIVPLIYGSAFGMLAIANRDPNYYRSSMGTLFLSYIADVLNRVLPGQISKLQAAVQAQHNGEPVSPLP